MDILSWNRAGCGTAVGKGSGHSRSVAMMWNSQYIYITIVSEVLSVVSQPMRVITRIIPMYNH